MHRYVTALALCLLPCPAALAQEAVTPAAHPDALFTSKDPRLNANKQVVYHLMKDVLEAGHVELAERYMTARYLQYNPNIPSGREVIKRIMGSMGPPRPIPARLSPGVVAVTAEGDLVIVAHAITRPDPDRPGQTYTMTGFDMWRIKDGKADEHWDSMPMGRPPVPAGPPPAGMAPPPR